MSDETKPTNAMTPDEARELVGKVLRPMDYCDRVGGVLMYGSDGDAISGPHRGEETEWLSAQHIRDVCRALESLAAQVERLKREAGKVVLAFHDWPVHATEFADSERRRALMDLAEEAGR
jgi:hypothetical protein